VLYLIRGGIYHWINIYIANVSTQLWTRRVKLYQFVHCPVSPLLTEVNTMKLLFCLTWNKLRLKWLSIKTHQCQCSQEQDDFALVQRVFFIQPHGIFITVEQLLFWGLQKITSFNIPTLYGGPYHLFRLLLGSS